MAAAPDSGAYWVHGHRHHSARNRGRANTCRRIQLSASQGLPGIFAEGYPLKTSERFIPVEKYLRTMYHPDRDYVDGHLEIRNLGTWEHRDWQGAFVLYFRKHAREWGIYAVPECRLQVRPDNFRIPDVMVVSRDKKPEPIIRDAPLLCIEVLSPKDTVKRTMYRVEDYIAMGVKAVWVLDPKRSDVLVVTADTSRWVNDRILTVDGTSIRVDLDELAADLAD